MALWRSELQVWKVFQIPTFTSFFSLLKHSLLFDTTCEKSEVALLHFLQFLVGLGSNTRLGTSARGLRTVAPRLSATRSPCA